MNILIIGANGTIGKTVTAALRNRHNIITAGRSSGEICVNIRDESSIRTMFDSASDIDACICTAASGAMDDFKTLTASELLENIKGKLMGQINLVLIGQDHLNDGGSFTLTSGIFADRPGKGVTGGGVISGGLHSFVLSAAIELPRDLRINCVSPGMAEDSVDDFGDLFPELIPIPMNDIAEAYRRCVESSNNGEILRLYEPS